MADVVLLVDAHLAAAETPAPAAHGGRVGRAVEKEAGVARVSLDATGE